MHITNLSLLILLLTIILLFVRKWEASFYLNLPVFIGSREDLTNKVKNRADRSVLDLIKLIKTGQKSRMLDIAT